MKYRLLLALFASALVLAVAHAQADDDDDDQEFDYFAYFTRAHNNLTFGFRATQGAKVKFGNLGTIPAANVISYAAGNKDTRVYDNGTVNADAARIEETTPGNGYVNLGNGRYRIFVGETDNSGKVITLDGVQLTKLLSEGVSYADGYTRAYSINSSTQVQDTSVTYNQYSVNSDGIGFNGKRALSGGVELQAERLFTDPSKRIRFSIVGGLSLNGINSKRSGTVTSTLHILSDTYTLNSPLPADTQFQYAAPLQNSSNIYYDAAGQPFTYPSEISPQLSSTVAHTSSEDEDGAEVTGVWEVKGAYLVLRIGPELSGSITPNLSFSASAGLAGAFVGTNYSATESTILTDTTVTNTTLTTGTITSEENKFLGGYYANLDASWAVNERTGFYAGLSYESYGDYNQSLAGRTARVDLGGTASLRGGLSIKF